MWCSRWNQPLGGNLSASRAYPYPECLPCAQRRLGIDDYCRHDDVDLDTNEDHHAIRCNQCGRWWQCYGDLQGAWRDFLKYGRMDDSNPSTVSISCSPKAWPTADNEAEDAAFEYGIGYEGTVVHGGS